MHAWKELYFLNFHKCTNGLFSAKRNAGFHETRNIFNSSKNLNFAILSPLSDNKEFLNYKIFSKREQNQKDLIEVDRVDGYAMILDKLKFENNFFDEKFFLYLENDDFV